jgi:hypothetical protein
VTQTRLSGQLIRSASVSASAIMGTIPSASFATTASFALNAGGSESQFSGSAFPFSGSAVITGSLLVSGSGITGSLFGTSSWATNVVSSSFATTASFALNAGGSGFPFSGDASITGSLRVSGSGITTVIESDATIQGVRVGRGGGGNSLNVVLGALTLTNNTTGESNTAVGSAALRDNTTGNSNTGIGRNVLLANQTGNANTAIAHGALQVLVNGSNNVAVGRGAGNAIVTGSNNTIIGAFTSGETNLSSTVIIGAGTAERLRINSAGNMGIGTTAPTDRLTVSGSISASGDVYVGRDVVVFGSIVGALTGSLDGTATYAVTASYISGALDIPSGLVVSGSLVVTGSGVITGSLTVSGSGITVRGSVDTDRYSLGLVSLGNASGSMSINLNNGNYFTATTTAATNWSITNTPSNRAVGFVLALTSGGAQPQTWPGAVRWPNATAPNLTAAGQDTLTFITDNGGTTWRGVLSIKDSR